MKVSQEKNTISPIKKPKKNRNFYIALAICMSALGAAGWSTYESVKDFINPPKPEVKSTSAAKSREKSNSSHNAPSEIFDKNKILEKDPKVHHHHDQPIPYDNEKSPSKNNSPVSTKEDSEKLQAVSAEPSETLIVYPASKTVTKEFSDSKPTYSKTFGDWRAHDGADFQAESGSFIKSITSGTVKDVYNDPLYGTTIVVEHDPKFTAYYSGLGETTLVKKDQRVTSGQDIGSINKVPCEIADEPHLHLAINKDGKFIDPLLILDKNSE